jgi:hypothetical protein
MSEIFFLLIFRTLHVAEYEVYPGDFMLQGLQPLSSTSLTNV